MPDPHRIKDWQFGMISRADVADFLVRQVDDRSLIGTTPLLVVGMYGCEAILRLTLSLLI